MKNYNLVFLFMFSVINSVWAGGIAGNGADLFVCRKQPTPNSSKGEIIYIALSDYYEAKYQYNLNLSPVSDNLSILEILNRFLSNFKKIDSHRADKYEKRARYFLSLIEKENSGVLLPGTAMTLYNDANHLIIPSIPNANCKVERIVNRIPDNIQISKPFVISKDLWDGLNNYHRSGVILHEVIYEEGIDMGYSTSESARYLHGLLVSQEITKMSISEYLHELSVLGNNNQNFYYYLDNIPFLPNNVKFFPDGEIKEGKIPWRVSEKLLKIVKSDRTLYLDDNQWVEFYPNGKIKYIRLKHRVPSTIKVKDKHLFIHSEISLHDNGNLRWANILESILFQIQNKIIQVAGNIEFYPSGHLFYGQIKPPNNQVVLKSNTGQLVTIKLDQILGAWFKLNEKEELIDWGNWGDL